ncbi:radical SAM family heme chaperone HemW [bacterium]|nr:MAG: radical SAM family heme chaperone HemW [bacterium]QQR61979.1 MAG: radical SAM family heme chaperone HemW [bacterium]QQR62428.1 MAG: radical SAM family heme chaperone HemW [bacterium]
MNFDYETPFRSLYIHWPFCPYRCHFCPFVALAGQDEYMLQYHDALVKEIQYFFDHYRLVQQEIDTVFLGGGTPSTYPTDLLLDTFIILKKNLHFQKDAEITIEVNPGTVIEKQVLEWVKMGINRVSVGVQSLKDGVLHELNRMQTKQQVITLMDFLPHYIENISVDLIMGLPGVLLQDWQSYLQEIITWPIKHISVYFLTIHEDTKLFFTIEKGKVSLPSDDYMLECYEWTVDFLKKNGFEQYELSNFARVGYQSRHNSIYWDRKPFKAFGLGACSFDGKARMQNEKNLQSYLKYVATKEPLLYYETLTVQQIRLEKALLGLRRSIGVCLNEISLYLSEEQKLKLNEEICQLCEAGFMTSDGKVIRLTQRGLIVENQILARLSI